MTISSLPPVFTSFVSPVSLRLRDINSFQIPRLTSSSSSSTASSTALTTFAAYETELLEALERCQALIQQGDLIVEELCEEAESSEDQPDQSKLMRSEWARIRGQYQNARTSSRTALLQGRRTLLDRKKSGALLGKPDEEDNQAITSSLAGSTNSGPNKSVRQKVHDRSTATGDDAALLASQDLTSALESTLSIMSDNLTQSAYSSQLLEESSSTLSTLSLDYATFNTLLQNSGGIIKSMERQDKIDALMLLGAYLFFGLCVGYILKVRIWDRGVGVFMILLKIFGLGGKARGKTLVEEQGVKEAIQQASKVGQGVAQSVTKQIAPVAAVTTSTLAEVLSSGSAAIAAAASSAIAGATAGLGGSQRPPEEIYIDISSSPAAEGVDFELDDEAKIRKMLEEEGEADTLDEDEDGDDQYHDAAETILQQEAQQDGEARRPRVEQDPRRHIEL